ncbi:MAG: hypothetical protein JWL65_2836 [Gammaproteobacteria bacterium]|nr:hypothetical protein [Gammaproteobacteria bacterium]
MEADSPQTAGLSDEARRWLAFFHLYSRGSTQTAIETGLIGPRKRPGFTMAVFSEIQAWATHADPGAAPGRRPTEY